MENASKALIIVAEVLIGILIIAIGVTLFRSFSDFGKITAEQMEQAKIDEWNSNFTKYNEEVSAIGENGKEIKHKIYVTAHDIVTVANLAREYNISREWGDYNSSKGITEVKRPQSNSDANLDYIQVYIKNTSGTKIASNFETDLYDKNEFLNNYALKGTGEDISTIYFKCNKYIINDATKKVCYIEFQELN